MPAEFFSIALASIAIGIALIIFIAFRAKIAALLQQVALTATQQQQDQIQILALEQQIAQLQEQLTLQQQKVSTLENTNQEQQLTTLQQQVVGIQQALAATPQDKLYARAIKMAELGADIDEIAKECDMPHVEVETLLAIRRQKTQN